ncbi:hypothetical protein HPT27_05075 [Permianibacter sp. IMCC34836]|uniref:hypothetical protein n=1 Tax=Permianibacter fluminis TaxID=2738515 RepID=UPI0015577233|nr:hypothetical protein [Permianibacter fluminis]NQD36390.1 hypothetical protein [Permianibacter fluminis]
MKRLWFWLRIVLDMAGAVMLALALFVSYLLFFEFRSHSADQEENAKTAFVPDYHQQLNGMHLGKASDWQLQGHSERACKPDTNQHLLQFKQTTGDAPTALGQHTWQRLEANPALISELIRTLEQSPCAAALAGERLSGRLPSLWFRIHEANWWDGQLQQWTVYIYDPRRATVLIWQNGFPP